MIGIYQSIKIIHISCAILSISGFIIRGVWMIKKSDKLHNRWVRFLPHWVDALLFSTGIAMLWMSAFSITSINWLSVKLFFVLLYIVLGMAALRGFKLQRYKVFSWLAAVLVACFIVSVAISKSVYGFLIYL